MAFGMRDRSATSSRPLIRMTAEDLAGEADQAGRRLVPGTGQQSDVAEDLLVGERARPAVLVLEFGVEQFGHEVVGGMLGPPGDVVGEHLAERSAVVFRLVRDPLLEAEPVVDLLADRLLVLHGDAEQHADDAHRHELAQIPDEVEVARPHQRVEHLGAEGAHLGLERLHLPGVNTRDSRPRWMSCVGGSSKRSTPGGSRRSP